MKLYRNVLILLVVFGLLLGAYFLYDYKVKNTLPDGSEDASSIITIFKADKDAISELILAGSDSTFSFKKEGDKWVQTSPKEVQLDQDKIDSIVGNISSINADKVIEENPSDLGVYGLQKPVATVTVKLTDGSTRIFYLGEKTPTRVGYFFKDKDKNTVYTIGSYTAENMNLDIDSLRKMDLFTVTAEDVIGIALEKGGKVSFSGRKTDAGWEMTEPLQVKGEETKLYPIIEKAVQFKAMEFIEDNPSDLEKYGLTNPAYTLQLETAASKDKLLFGKERVRGKEVYVKMAGGTSVYVMDESTFDFGDKKLRDVMDIFAYLADINTVSKLTVDTGSRKTVLDIDTNKDGDQDKDKFSINGREVLGTNEEETKKIKEYYQAVIGIMVEDIDLAGNPAAGSPAATFTYNLKQDPGVMKVEFISRNIDTYYVVKNGKYTGVYVKKQAIEDMKKVEDKTLEFFGQK